MVLILISVILLHLCNLCQNVDVDAFCAIECLNKADKHTICEYKCEEDPEQCSDFKHFPLSSRDRQLLLDLHNMYRNKVASGGDTRGGNGAAKDMIALKYDVDIEVTAYCWGKRCSVDHDKCRHLAKYSSAGQNNYFYGDKVQVNGSKVGLLKSSVKEWYDEIRFSTKEVLAKYQQVQKTNAGHFTQLVWATTEFMGCSRMTWTAKDASDFPYKFLVICNYSPAGNFLDSPVYQFGTGCSPPRSANDIYPALCGESNRMAKTGLYGNGDMDDYDEESQVHNRKARGRRNVTGRPWHMNASQINQRNSLLPWTCLLLYMNRRFYCLTTTY